MMKRFEEATKKESMKDALPANKTTEANGWTMRSPEEMMRMLREWREEHPDEHGLPYLIDILFEDDEDEEDAVDNAAFEKAPKGDER